MTPPPHKDDSRGQGVIRPVVRPLSIEGQTLRDSASTDKVGQSTESAWQKKCFELLDFSLTEYKSKNYKTGLEFAKAALSLIIENNGRVTAHELMSQACQTAGKCLQSLGDHNKAHDYYCRAYQAMRQEPTENWRKLMGLTETILENALAILKDQNNQYYVDEFERILLKHWDGLDDYCKIKELSNLAYFHTHIVRSNDSDSFITQISWKLDKTPHLKSQAEPFIDQMKGVSEAISSEEAATLIETSARYLSTNGLAIDAATAWFSYACAAYENGHSLESIKAIEQVAGIFPIQTLRGCLVIRSAERLLGEVIAVEAIKNKDIELCISALRLRHKMLMRASPNSLYAIRSSLELSSALIAGEQYDEAGELLSGSLEKILNLKEKYKTYPAIESEKKGKTLLTYEVEYHSYTALLHKKTNDPDKCIEHLKTIIDLYSADIHFARKCLQFQKTLILTLFQNERLKEIATPIEDMLERAELTDQIEYVGAAYGFKGLLQESFGEYHEAEHSYQLALRSYLKAGPPQLYSLCAIWLDLAKLHNNFSYLDQEAKKKALSAVEKGLLIAKDPKSVIEESKRKLLIYELLEEKIAALESIGEYAQTIELREEIAELGLDEDPDGLNYAQN